MNEPFGQPKTYIYIYIYTLSPIPGSVLNASPAWSQVPLPGWEEQGWAMVDNFPELGAGSPDSHTLPFTTTLTAQLKLPNLSLRMLQKENHVSRLPMGHLWIWCHCVCSNDEASGVAWTQTGLISLGKSQQFLLVPLRQHLKESTLPRLLAEESTLRLWG